MPSTAILLPIPAQQNSVAENGPPQNTTPT